MLRSEVNMYEKELEFCKATIKRASDLFCHRSFSISEKGAFDVVTDADKGIELFFAEKLKSHFPGDTLLGEEFSGNTELNDRTWILDPIDGTYNFATGSPHFGHQAALWDQGKLQLAVIYLPVLDEMYEARAGQGAFCNGKPISVSKRTKEAAIISFGDFPHTRPLDARDQKRMMEHIYPRIARARMFGAASVDFAYLASGRIEGCAFFTRNKWDLAPGWLLTLEAGGAVLGLSGEPYGFLCRGLFAVNTTSLFQDITEGFQLL